MQIDSDDSDANSSLGDPHLAYELLVHSFMQCRANRDVFTDHRAFLPPQVSSNLLKGTVGLFTVTRKEVSHRPARLRHY